MKKHAMLVWAILACIPCSLLAGNGVLSAKEEPKKDEVKTTVKEAVKTVPVSKKHGAPVKTKKRIKKVPLVLNHTTASEKNNGKTQQ